jgi:diguanylate cyclase (GGDEF)-like protein
VAFDERLKTTIALARRFQEIFAVLFVDLDGFKAVNDSFGHQTGDEVLRIVASRLRGTLRESDELARLGGDEFAIIAHTSPEGALVIRENVANIVVTPVVAAGKSIDIGLSAGVALFPGDGTTPEVLLAAADRDMYKMKQAHKRSRLRSIS